jgi:hypothetical protein
MCPKIIIFSTLDPRLLWVGISHSYFNILNVENCNKCAHTKAIIFISTSNSCDPTPKFQWPIWAIIFILTSNSSNPTLKIQRPLNHYMFKHRLVYLIYLIFFGKKFENCGCIFEFFTEKTKKDWRNMVIYQNRLFDFWEWIMIVNPRNHPITDMVWCNF